MSEYDAYPRDVWLEVDLGKLRKNIEVVKSHTGKRVLVVVKANAYGHGIVPCGLAAQEAGATMLGVATAGEAGVLRRAGINIPILRVTAFGESEIQSFIDDDIDFFAWTPEHIEHANILAEKTGKRARVHLKVDTGMGRSGVMPEGVKEIARIIEDAEHVEFAGLCSHFHSADVEDTSSADAQMEIFEQAVQDLEDMGIQPEYIHLANSPGLIRFEHARYNMVRSGIVTYGQFYERGFDLIEGMEPIAQWKAQIVSVKTLPADHAISYAAKYRTSKEETIAMLPVGYADGWHRFPDHVNEVLVQGRPLKVVGRVCMDQCMLLVPDDMDVKVGEEAVLMGSQEDAHIDSLDIADRWGTNNYDVVAGISARVPRVYV